MNATSPITSSLSGAFIDAAWMIALGVIAIGLCGAVISSAIKASRWRQAIWQVVAIAMLALIAVEVTGVAGALVNGVLGDQSVTDNLNPRRAPGRMTSGERRDARGSEDAVEVAAVLPDSNRDHDPENGEVEEPGGRATWMEFGDISDLTVADLAPLQSNEGQDQPIEKHEPIAVTKTAGSAARKTGLEPLVAGIWCLGFCVCVVHWLIGSWRLHRFAKGLKVLQSDPVCAEVRDLVHRLSVKQRVRVAEHDLAEGPVTFGVLRPTVVVPARFLSDYLPAERRVMLAHELAHLAARDPAWRLLCRSLCSVLWFHPMVWFVKQQLETVSELAADDAALIVPDGPCLLAECLVRLGRRIERQNTPGWVAMSGNGFRSSLGRRVDRLLDMPRREYDCVRPRKSRTIKSLGVTMALCAAIVSTSSARSVPQTGDPQMNLIRSWKRSLAGLTMLTVSGAAIANQDAEEVAPPREVAAESADFAQQKEAESEEAEHQERQRGERRERKEVESRDRRVSDEARENRARREREMLPQRRREVDRERRDPRDRGDRGDRDDRPEQDRRRMRGAEERLPPGNRDDRLPSARRRQDENEREGTEHRIEQMMHAAEKLQRSGFEDDAQNLRRIADELRQHFERSRAEKNEMIQLRQMRDRERERGVSHSRELMEVIREMRDEFAQLRRDVDELRRRVDGSRDRPRENSGRNNEGDDNRRGRVSR